MLRETIFAIGGYLTMALGVLLALGLVYVGAGWWYFEGYVGSAAAVGLGAFFVYVGAEARRSRRKLLADGEVGYPSGTGPPSPPRA